MLDSIAGFFNDLYSTFTDFIKAFLNTLLDGLKETLFWLFDSVMSMGTTLLAGITGNPQFSLAQYFTILPAETRNVVALMGLPECLVLIVAAIAIRFTLQLIPMTRLGS
jgi:hypothetical protein